MKLTTFAWWLVGVMIADGLIRLLGREPFDLFSATIAVCIVIVIAAGEITHAIERGRVFYAMKPSDQYDVVEIDFMEETTEPTP